MIDTNKLPALEMEVASMGSHKHQPVVLVQVVAGIVIGIVIASNDP